MYSVLAGFLCNIGCSTTIWFSLLVVSSTAMRSQLQLLNLSFLPVQSIVGLCLLNQDIPNTAGYFGDLIIIRRSRSWWLPIRSIINPVSSSMLPDSNFLPSITSTAIGLDFLLIGKLLIVAKCRSMKHDDAPESTNVLATGIL